MMNDRLNGGMPLAARVVHADDIVGQACHDWHYVLEIFARFAGTSVDHSVRRAAVS